MYYATSVCSSDRYSADGPREFCGVFGIFGSERASEFAYLGLYAVQHRGQESAGIAASNGKYISLHKGMGLVRQVFSSAGVMKSLKGNAAIGHNRYSTTGAPDPINAQPVLIQYKRGQLAAAHNGNLTNAAELRRRLEEEGSIFQTTSDSEVVLHLMARSKKSTLPEMLIDALAEVEGAYNFLFLSADQLIAVRDPFGFRPLSLGKVGDAYVVASETCAFDIIGAEYIRAVEPGEMIILDKDGMRSLHLPKAERCASCIFEYIYFARPDSRIFGARVEKVRREFGRQLAREKPCAADVVIAVPDSANIAALGYAEESGIHFDIGLIRNHYVGRTFIAPHQHERDMDVRVKFNPVESVLAGKRVALVEDSIVRGTTLRRLVKLVRTAGPSEVHVRVSSPPILYPCFYGIDMSSPEELIATSRTIDEICEYVGADTLGYLSVDGMLKCVDCPEDFCTCCFTGNYPTAVPKDFDKNLFDLKSSCSH